jgi:arylformamidase
MAGRLEPAYHKSPTVRIEELMLIDISRELKAGMAVWPGDTAYQLEQTMALEQGDSVNLTTLTLSAHTGSHIDAPRHFSAEGLAVDQLALTPYWGKAQVVTINKISGPLIPDDFKVYDLSLAPRILVRSVEINHDSGVFPEQFVYPSPELAGYLGRLGIILYGTEAPSMDPADSKTLEGHQAMNHHQIAILEWLDLSQAADGLYDLVALPLKITGGDGSPVRAVLRQPV